MPAHISDTELKKLFLTIVPPGLAVGSLLSYSVEKGCFFGAKQLQKQEAEGTLDTLKKATVYTLCTLGIVAGAASAIMLGSAAATGLGTAVSLLGASNNLSIALSAISGFGILGIKTFYTIDEACHVCVRD